MEITPSVRAVGKQQFMGPVCQGAAGSERAGPGTERGKLPVLSGLVNLCSSVCFCHTVGEMDVDGAFIGLEGSF